MKKDDDDVRSGRSGSSGRPGGSGRPYGRQANSDGEDDDEGPEVHEQRQDYHNLHGQEDGGEHDHDDNTYNTSRASTRKRMTGPLPDDDSVPEDWVYNKEQGNWSHEEATGHAEDLDVSDLKNADGDSIMPGELQVRDDGLLLYHGKPVQGTDGSWVVQSKEGTLEDGSGRNIDVSITPDRRLVAHVVRGENEEEEQDTGDERYSGRHTRQDDSAPETRRMSEAERERFDRDFASLPSGIGLGTPDGTPCTLNEYSELVWNKRTVKHAGGRISWRRGERPRDAQGRRVVGVTEGGAAIVLNEHDDPIVLPVGVSGQALRSHDGREVVEPLGGRPQLRDGTKVLVGPDGRPVHTQEGIVAIEGEDGNAVGPDGDYIRSIDGRSPVSLSPEGTPRDHDGPMHVVVSPENTMYGALTPGTAVSGHDGRVITGPDSRPVTVAGDGRSIVGPDGNMTMGPSGAPVGVGNSGRPESPRGTPVNVYVTPQGRAVVEGLDLQGVGTGVRSSREMEREKEDQEAGYRTGVQNDALRQQVREVQNNLDDAHDHLDRALQDLEVERELSRSLKEKVDLLSRDFGAGTRYVHGVCVEGNAIQGCGGGQDVRGCAQMLRYQSFVAVARCVGCA